jgi:hypothetical protein
MANILGELNIEGYNNTQGQQRKNLNNSLKINLQPTQMQEMKPQGLNRAPTFEKKEF